MTFAKPYRVVSHGPYSMVMDAAGAIVAQGSAEMCAEVAAGRLSTIQRQGDLFDAD